jgi:hypothetical protein
MSLYSRRVPIEPIEITPHIHFYKSSTNKTYSIKDDVNSERTS